MMPAAGHLASSTYQENVQSCLEDQHSYCINGICIFHKELQVPTCRCLAGYSGERCEHLMLNSHAQDPNDHYIAVGIGAGMLLIGLFAAIYCCLRKRYRKTNSSYKVCREETAL
nr:epigen [Zootoca vivipara]